MREGEGGREGERERGREGERERGREGERERGREGREMGEISKEGRRDEVVHGGRNGERQLNTTWTCNDDSLNKRLTWNDAAIMYAQGSTLHLQRKQKQKCEKCTKKHALRKNVPCVSACACG